MIVGVAAWICLLISLYASRIASRMRTLVDSPNHRSSHRYETSKAGGVAIMGAWIVAMFIVGSFSFLPDTGAASLKLGLLGVAAFAVGFVDDYYGLSPLPKFVGQCLAVALFIVFFASLQAAPVPLMGEIALGAGLGVFITGFWIIGFMNAYNFMDGANGIAGSCAVIVLSTFAVICAFSGEPFLAAAAFLLGVAVFGFIPSNMRRKNLFMGDNGSQSISFLIAVFGVIAANWTDGRISALFMPVAFLPFIFDVAFTVTHRLIRGQNVLVAHREHLYQLLMRLGNSHERVAVTYMTMTALSSSLAAVMLLAPVQYQWAFPTVGVIALMAFAVQLFTKARAGGLLDPRDETDDSDREETATSENAVA